MVGLEEEREFGPEWMPLYVRRLLASGAYALMSNEAFGCYIKLLLRQWEDGFLPENQMVLARFCFASDLVWQEVWPQLENHFPISARGRENPILTEIRSKQMGRIQVLKANGSKGGRPKNQKDNQAVTNSRYRERDKERGNNPPNPPSFDPLSVAIPAALDCPEFRAAWSGWFEYRREQKYPTWKEKTTKSALAWLSSQADPIGTIAHSVRNGYRGLFEIGKGPAKSTPPSMASELARLTGKTP